MEDVAVVMGASFGLDVTDVHQCCSVKQLRTSLQIDGESTVYMLFNVREKQFYQRRTRYIG